MDDASKRNSFKSWYFTAHGFLAAAILFLAAVFFGAYCAVIKNPLLTEFCILKISKPIRMAIGRMNSHVSLSVMEIMYAAAFLWLVAHVIRTVKICLKDRAVKSVLRTVALRLMLIVAVCAMLLTGYCWLWGLDYHGRNFTERSGIALKPVDAETLYTVAKLFLENANELSACMPRTEDGSFNKSKTEILNEYSAIYENAEKIFPCLEGVSYRPKAMIASKFMSWTGFTGVYFPFTGESNINMDAPASLMAMTVTHELAHQRGVYAEDECNFIGVMASVKCDNEVYRYSGYLGGLIYLMNALYEIDKDAWMELRSNFSAGLEQDWTENNRYWQSYEGVAEEIAGDIYDGYLKANGQEMGIRSYDACVTLIVAYFSEK